MFCKGEMSRVYKVPHLGLIISCDLYDLYDLFPLQFVV